MSQEKENGNQTDQPVLYETKGPVAIISLNRPDRANAQNVPLLYELDAAFTRAVEDDEVKAIILRGEGKHFTAGHDLGGDHGSNVPRRSLWYSSEGREGSERGFAFEKEAYLGLCRRWRALPKPTIAAVQGACIAGGLMLAWSCDIIVASEDAYFCDPVVDFGVPGVEYFAHPFEMPARIAREFLLLGDKMSAARAYEVGMANRVVPRSELMDEAMAIATKMSKASRFALALTKEAFNFVEDLGGKRSAMDGVFGLHHLSHAHAHITGTSLSEMKDKPKYKNS